MKAIYYTLPVVALAVGLLLGAYWFSQNIAFGSVIPSGEYNAKLVTSSDATSTVQTIVKSSAGTLGSITFTSVSTTTVNSFPLITVYDAATTTAASTTLTKVAEIGAANATLGTYTFDVNLANGMSLWINPAFDGVATITWR